MRAPACPATAFAATFVWVVAVALLTCAGFVFAVDPWRMFHRSWLGPDLYLENQRVANAGLIRTADMSVVTIGTSMMENIRPADVEAVFGGRAQSLVISGSTAYEQSVVAEAALARESVETLIWGLDWFPFMNPVDQARHNRVLPVELYRFTLEGRLKYLFGLDPLVDAVRIAGASIGGTVPDDLSTDPFALHQRAYDPSDAHPEQVRERAAQPGYHRDWLAIRDGMICTRDTLEANIRANLVPVLRMLGVRQHAHLYFVPYSDVQMALFQRYMPDCFDLLPAFRLMIADAVAPFAQKVSLHDAQAPIVPTGDLRYYTDPLHHVGAVDRVILEAMASGQIAVDRRSLRSRVEALQVGWTRAYAANRELFPALAE